MLFLVLIYFYLIYLRAAATSSFSSIFFSPVFPHSPPPPSPGCGADGPAYGQPPLVLTPCKQILPGLKRKSLIKQLCVYNYVLNYLRVSLLCCSLFARSLGTTTGVQQELFPSLFSLFSLLLPHFRDFFWRESLGFMEPSLVPKPEQVPSSAAHTKCEFSCSKAAPAQFYHAPHLCSSNPNTLGNEQTL